MNKTDKLAWETLISESASMLRYSPCLPNLSMLYSAEYDSLVEGFIWNGWWIQNSYGFTLGYSPFMKGFWKDSLQRSYDRFWDRIGDGKRIGADSGTTNEIMYSFCAPDGSLGDCVLPDGIVYKQGDGDCRNYDWFYEATAAGVVMQCELLLFGRNRETLDRYIPLMKRSLEMIEKTRAENGLFLVGPSANLLAPSYGGSYDAKTDTIGKGYLSGLTVTYSAALERMIEVLTLADRKEDCAVYEQRLRKNLDSLDAFLTDEGYFVRSKDPDGTLHGVYGQEKYGYFESSPNVDAIALGIADDSLSERIYNKLSSIDGLRRAGVLCANYPHYDDTYESFRKKSSDPDSTGYKSGDWVDGGCWATVEGRAILAYLRLGKYEDAYRAAETYMKWAREYRQDAPFSQWGMNTHNPWALEPDDGQYDNCRPVAVITDNFAPASCLLRGLFGLRAYADRLELTPHIPKELNTLDLPLPVVFGDTEIFCMYRGDGTVRFSCLDDGTPLRTENGRVILPAALLKEKKRVTLTLSDRETTPLRAETESPVCHPDGAGLPDKLAGILKEALCAWEAETDGDRLARLYAVLSALEADSVRRCDPSFVSELRPMTDGKKAAILALYDNAVKELWKGYENHTSHI